MERRGLFVGIGIDAYDSHEPLHHAVAEVKAVAEVLRADFAGEPLLDADLAQVLEHLKAVPDCLDTGPMVLLWCGHGVQSGTKLWLETRDDRGEINAADVIARCARSGANQLLFIVDTCQAGAGVVRSVVGQHGNLQANPWALDELEEVLATEPVRRRAGATVPVRVGVPDLILTGELLPVVVDVEADRPPAVRIQIVAEGEPERIVASRTPRIRDGHLDTSFAGLAPGAYEVRVTGLGTGSPVSPVTAPVLVWPQEPFQRRPPVRREFA